MQFNKYTLTRIIYLNFSFFFIVGQNIILNTDEISACLDIYFTLIMFNLINHLLNFILNFNIVYEIEFSQYVFFHHKYLRFDS